MLKKIILAIIGLVVIFFVAAAISGKGKTPTLPARPAPSGSVPPSPPSGTVLKGLGYWPVTIASEYSNRFFDEIKGIVDVLVIQKGDPFDQPKEGEYPKANNFLDAWLDRGRGTYKTYVGLEPFNGDRTALDVPPGWAGPAPKMTDKAWQDQYADIVVRNVKRHKNLAYLNPCVEVNMWYRVAKPEEWQAWRDLYSRIYRAVKEISPNTKVFCSLQYDLLAGKFYYGGGPQWELLDDPDTAIPNQDFLGISTYPYGTFDNWFEGLRARHTPPIFVAEMGYMNPESVYPMSGAAEQKQKELIEKIPELFAGLNLRALLWIGYDDGDPTTNPGLPQWFYTLGFVNHDYSPKPALEAWKKLFK